MNIDANAVITKLNAKLADANLQITILELQLEQYEQADEQKKGIDAPLEADEVLPPKEENK
jgi:hypothetical protein